MSELLNTLLENEDKHKHITINEKFIVKKIEINNEIDLIILDLQKDNNLYQGLVMEKGYTFPIPKKNDVLFLEKMYLKYNEEFQLKLYIEGKNLKEEQTLIQDIKMKVYDCSHIFNTLANINKKTISKINSSIFIIMNIINNKITVKSLNDSKIYHIELKNSYKKIGEFLWIYYYEFIGDKIEINNLSILEILNDERLMRLLERLTFENIKLFHIVDINDENFTLIDSEGKLFELNKSNNNKFIKNYKFDFCTNIILSNFIIVLDNKIELNEFSFIYRFKDESYYIENIFVNSYAVVQFNFVDFKKDNIFNYIYADKQEYFILNDTSIEEENPKEEINLKKENKGEEETKIKEEKTKMSKEELIKKMEEELKNIEKRKVKQIEEEKEKQKKRKKNFSLKISKKIEYIIIPCTTFKKYEYFPFNITIYNSEKEEEYSMTFTVYLFPGLMNKINAFINYYFPKAYFYEFFYYNISDNLAEFSKNIIIEGKEYKIDNSDNFGSKNRKRICIMNIPYQKNEVHEDELKTNSIQICELIEDVIHKIIGIFDISFENFNEENTNDYFDDYYSEFGDIYDLVLTNYKKENLNEIINKIKKFDSMEFDYDFSDLSEFVDLMTFSQFKTRAGLIICQFLNNNKVYIIKKIIEKISNLYKTIKDENLNYSEILRILVYTLSNYDNTNIELKFISKLNKNSPYLIAYKFNIEQINILNENSPLFQAYLQLDSYKAYNYIHQNESHTFSMELIFMMKYQLLSTYEQFFFIKKESGDEYAYLDNKTKITVLNEINILGSNYYEEIIKTTEMANNYAMPVSINFLHEKSGHYKYQLKNRYPDSPLFYFKGLKIKVKIAYVEGHFIGESGLIIQDFICDDENIIEELLSNFIYGYLLDKKYFGGKDFKKLNKEIKEQTKKNKNKPKSQNKTTNVSFYNKAKSPPKFNGFIKHSDLKYSSNDFKKPNKKEKMIKLRKILEHREKLFEEKKKKLKESNQA